MKCSNCQYRELLCPKKHPPPKRARTIYCYNYTVKLNDISFSSSPKFANPYPPRLNPLTNRINPQSTLFPSPPQFISFLIQTQIHLTNLSLTKPSHQSSIFQRHPRFVSHTQTAHLLSTLNSPLLIQNQISPTNLSLHQPLA